MVFRVDAVQERLLRLEEVISDLRELARSTALSSGTDFASAVEGRTD